MRLALLDPGFDLDLALALTGGDEVVAADRLDELVVAGIVQEVTGGRFAIVDEGGRRDLAAGLTPEERRQAHAVAAVVLERQGALEAIVAGHLLAAARPSQTEDAVDHAAAVAGRIGIADPAGASRLLRGAVAATTRSGPRRERLEEAWVAAATASGSVAGARDAWAARMDGDGSGPEAVVGWSVVAQLAGDFAGPDRAIGVALADGGLPASPRARLLITRATGRLWWWADFAGAGSDARVASALAAEGGDPGLAVAAAGLAAWSGLAEGRADAHQVLDAALTAFVETDDAAMAGADRWMAHLGSAAMAGERLVEAEQVLVRVRHLADGAAHRDLLTYLDLNLGRSLLFQGRLEEADVVLQRAVDGYRSDGDRCLLAPTLAAQAMVGALRGDLRSTAARADEAWSLGEELGDSYIRAGTALLVTIARATQHLDRAAADLVIEAGGGDDLPRLQIVDRAYGFELLAAAAVADGDLDAARRWASRARAVADGPMARAAAERATSVVAAAVGDHDGAAEAGRQAATAAASAGGRLEAARGRLLSAQASSAAGEKAAAVTELERVWRTTDDLGAEVLRAEATRSLRRLGRRSRRVAGPGAARLSQREREVAELVSAGTSNRDVGVTLFISERTVESHVARILAKLDVTSRASVGAALRRIDAMERAGARSPARTSVPAAPEGGPPTGPARRLLADRARAADRARTGASAAVQAELLVRCATPGDHRAARVLATAAEQATDPAERARWSEERARLMPERDGDGRSAAFATAGVAWAEAGDAELALDAALRAVDAAAGDDHLVVALARQGQMARAVGRRSEADASHERLARLILGVRGAARAAGALALAREAMRRADLRAVGRWAALARRGPRPGASSGAVLADALLALADPIPDDTHLDQLVCRAAALGDDPTATEARFVVGMAALLADRSHDAVGVLEGIAARGATPWVAATGALLGHVLGIVGRVDEARSAVVEATGRARSGLDPEVLALALAVGAVRALADGELGHALGSAAEIPAVLEGVPAGSLTAWAGLLVTPTVIAGGDAAQAGDDLVLAAGGPELSLLLPGLRPSATELLVLVAVAAGDTAAADRWVRHRAANGPVRGSAVPPAARARAHVDLAAGRAGCAAAALAEVATRCDGQERVATLRLLGTALVADGRVDDGVAQLRRAGSEARAHGDQRTASLIVRDLRRHGTAVAAPGRVARPAGLTPRQAEVAELVVAGRTNRQIAAALLISEKTAERHVSAILQQLAVESRHAVGPALEARRAQGPGGGHPPG